MKNTTFNGLGARGIYYTNSIICSKVFPEGKLLHTLHMKDGFVPRMGPYSFTDFFNSCLFKYDVTDALSNSYLRLRELISNFNGELNSNYDQSAEKINEFSKTYFLSIFLLNHIIDPLIDNRYLSLAIKMIISSLILNGFNKNGLSYGVKLAIIVPFLSYVFTISFPRIYSKLLMDVITNIIRSIVACILFVSKDEFNKLIPLLPGIILAGAMRGFIMNLTGAQLEKSGYTDEDIYYYSTLMRHLLEPQVKKCEKIF